MGRVKMLTTKEVQGALRERGVEVSYSNLALWVRSGRFAGAQLQPTPRGPVWMIPAASVDKFQPPRRGPKPRSGAAAVGRVKKGGK